MAKHNKEDDLWLIIKSKTDDRYKASARRARTRAPAPALRPTAALAPAATPLMRCAASEGPHPFTVLPLLRPACLAGV